jgi:hypothetical protein
MADTFTHMSGHPVKLEELGVMSDVTVYALAVSMESTSITVSGGTINNINTVSTVSEVINISSIDTVDVISSVVTLTEVTNISSLDTVDYVVSLGTVSKVLAGTVTVIQSTHNNLNCNANLQVGDADVAVGNKVPVNTYLDTNLEKLVAINPVVSATYTRPADVVAYAANDVISSSTSSPTNLTIATGLTTGSSCIITSARIRIDISAVTSGMAGFRLALFSSAPTAIADNAAFDLIDADKDKFLDYIDINTPVDLGSRIWGTSKGINSHIMLTTQTLYAQLITLGAYTPTSAAVCKVYLGLMELRN